MKTRANINLDADVYDFASAYAAARGLALGTAVSELLWVEQQRIDRARIKREGRNARNWFLLVLALVILTVAVARYFPTFR